MGVSSTCKSTCVRFSTQGYENAELFKKICQNLKISCSIIKDKRKLDFWYVHVTNKNNFRKIIELKGISHLKRKSNLYNIFIKARYSNHIKF